MRIKQIILLLVIASLLLAGCGQPTPQTYTIGILMDLAWLQPIYDNFKVTMTELGYVEGQNVTYIYNPLTTSDEEAFTEEAQRLVAQKVDLIFAIGGLSAAVAKTAVEGTSIPVVFDPVINPLGTELVQSIAQPGGNVTGVQVVDRSLKGLDWALKMLPETQYIFLPHNPEDPFSSAMNEQLLNDIPQLGVKVLPSSVVTTPEEMIAAVKTLPENTIIYVTLLAGNLEAGLDDFVRQAEKHHIPVFSTGRGGEAPFSVADFTTTYAGEAEQGARMVDRILKGANPANTPIETAEYYLFVNLKAAQAYGITISNDILGQADHIIR